MRSILPPNCHSGTASAVNTANRMLDEPPLIARRLDAGVVMRQTPRSKTPIGGFRLGDGLHAGSLTAGWRAANGVFSPRGVQLEVMLGCIHRDWNPGRKPTGKMPVTRGMGILPMSGPDRPALMIADFTSSCTCPPRVHLSFLQFGCRPGR